MLKDLVADRPQSFWAINIIWPTKSFYFYTASRLPLFVLTHRSPVRHFFRQIIKISRYSYVCHGSSLNFISEIAKQSNVQVARIQVQQAYLRNCLDYALALQLNSTIQQTTPVMGGGGVTCISNLSAIFKRKYPTLLRRKQFFSMLQQPSQDQRAFLESLKAGVSEADVGGMTLQDALCMMLVSGIRDTRLKEKLSEHLVHW